MKNKKREQPIITIIRLVLASVFIFSGFVKGVDPWGTAIKTGEYLTAFGMDWMVPARYGLSIAQCAIELWLGFLLLFNVMKTFGRFFVTLFMLFFTILTLIIAIRNPVADCGCFGDAIKLNNWQTFYKNLILLPMSVMLLFDMRNEVPRRNDGQIFGFVLLILSVVPPVSAMLSMPWIDFLPYKVGTDITEAMALMPDMQGEYRTTLIYKNIDTGETVEFETSDTTWYNTEKWEFIETRHETIREAVLPEIHDFVIFSSDRNITSEILSEEEAFLFIVDRLENLAQKDGVRLGAAARYAEEHGIRYICLTTSTSEASTILREWSGMDIPCYNLDGTTMKSLIRAHKGLVVLEKGTILAKMNLRNVPDFNKSGKSSARAYFAAKERKNREYRFIIISFIIIGGLLVWRYRLRE